MNICGIAAEYNPFHNGHALHIAETRAALRPDYIVIAMSGDFTQRGEPAIADKRERARAALLNGADAVAEIPAYFTLSGAPHFASCAVKILSILGARHISFGAETPDLAALTHAASIPENKTAFRTAINGGKPYAAAYAAAFGDNILNTPNNLLAVEYIRAVSSRRLPIAPFAVKRSAPHDSGGLCASALRSLLRSGDPADNAAALGFMPDNQIYFPKPRPRFFSDILRHIAATRGQTPFNEACGAAEGLGVRIYRASLDCEYMGEIISSAKTRRFSESRVRRCVYSIILAHNYVNFNTYLQSGYTNYARILGFRKSAEPLISKAAASPFNIVLNLKKDIRKLEKPWGEMIEADIRASDLYQASLNGKFVSEYSHPLVII